MDLKSLQKLPHKWWKRNQKYEPCLENVLVDMEGFNVTIKLNENELKENIVALTNLHLYEDRNPTRFDWFYAINTELMEYKQHPSDEELADIAIFCFLYLKIYYGYSFQHLPKDLHTMYIEPIYSWLANTKQSIINLLIWSLTSTKIKDKIEYNQRREDHVCSRR